MSTRIKDEHTLQYDTVKWTVTSEFALLGFYYVYKVPHSYGSVFIWICGLLMLDIIGIVLILIAQRGKGFARLRYIHLLDLTTEEFSRVFFLVMRGLSLTVDESNLQNNIVQPSKQKYTTLLWWDRHILICYVSVILLPILLFILLASYSLGGNSAP